MSESNKRTKCNKQWFGLEPHEAFTEPVKDRDPGGKISSSGVKMQEELANEITRRKSMKPKQC